MMSLALVCDLFLRPSEKPDGVDDEDLFSLS
jgi:hypothetical protein